MKLRNRAAPSSTQRTAPTTGLFAGLMGATAISAASLAMLSGCATAGEGDMPPGCGFDANPRQDASMSCYQDLDRNGDGALSREEINQLPRTRGRFEEMDLDASGTVSPKEFQDGIETLLQRAGGKGV